MDDPCDKSLASGDEAENSQLDHILQPHPQPRLKPYRKLTQDELGVRRLLRTEHELLDWALGSFCAVEGKLFARLPSGGKAFQKTRNDFFTVDKNS